MNYGRRLLKGHLVALFGEIISSRVRCSMFLARLAQRRTTSQDISAAYRSIRLQIDGQPNQAPRELARGVFDFGAGVDVQVWRFVALRGEARDFYTGAPNYNVASVSGRQHNIVAMGALVLRWH